MKSHLSSFVVFWRLWMSCAVWVVIILVGSPFARRYLTLHALLLLNKVKIICVPARVCLELAVERFQVRCQIAVVRLQLGYLLLKRFVWHKMRKREDELKGSFVNQPDKHNIIS